MRIEIRDNYQIESFYQGMTEPEGYGAFDDPSVIDELSSWCPLCGEGENHRDIKICIECLDHI